MMSKNFSSSVLMSLSTGLIGVVSILILSVSPVLGQDNPEIPSLYQNLEFRSVGPAVTGGRIHDIEALADDPSTVYAATASGGIWKTTNKGTTWEPIFDDKPVSTFGDLDIAPSNPDVIWAGTGEQNNRQSTSWGNGVYRSTDAGKNWIHLGLEETRHIGRVKVHPENPEVAYVAALGNLWKGTEERGVFKTTDGGESWKKVLFIDEHTGVVDLVMDPEDPNTLYASAYQRLRRTWGFNGGGPGSGIYKTTDGGESWNELTEGIPSGDKGRIGLTIAETNANILYATIEHADSSGTYRTVDAGKSWERVNELNPRPMYYSHIVADPTDEERVYILATEFYMSDDGGETFRQMPTRPTYDVGVHSDHHTLWINPSNPEHFYLAGDAGLHESWDRGETYNRINNIPIGQFYAIGLDMRDPYYIYGGMQDNHSWVGPNANRRYMGIIDDDWSQVGFGDGMYHRPDPTNYRYVYSNSQNGGMTRLDPKTGDLLDIRPYPKDEDEEYRFDWVTPIELSSHDPSTVYFGGNRLFISHDKGVSWNRTKDLTRGIHRDSLSLMGVDGTEDMLSKHDGTSSYAEIVTISESPLNSDIIWVGTDDGNIQVSRDGGDTWSEVAQNMKGVSYGTYVSRVEASTTDEGTIYATLDAHRDGDFAPYVYKSTDFGKSWVKITDGLPDEGSVNVITEHPDNPQLLFLGTEHHLYISNNGGNQWHQFGANLPTTLYDDLEIHPRENDLVVGTHGRSIWILDDLTPLIEWTDNLKNKEAHLFSMQSAQIMQYWKSTSYRGQESFFGENPPQGTIINYYLSEDTDSVDVEVRNSSGKLVRTLKGPGKGGTIQRLNWNLRHEPPPVEEEEDEEEEGLIMSEDILPELPRSTDTKGPFVSPGAYKVILKAGGNTLTKTVTVEDDPEMPIDDKEWHAREDFLLEVADMQRQIWDAAEEAADIQKKLHTIRDTLESEGAVPQDLKNRVASVDSLADKLGAESRYDGLRDDIYDLAAEFIQSGVSQRSLYPPTNTHRQRKQRLATKLEEYVRDLREEIPLANQVIEKYENE
jgi:photosystem II stability/assembly factor-like uncharacterized protein